MTQKRHDESIKDEEGEWQDVSEEVAAEIAAIWESEYGAGWRERYIERCVWRTRLTGRRSRDLALPRHEALRCVYGSFGIV